jgi:hypothetical protein
MMMAGLRVPHLAKETLRLIRIGAIGPISLWVIDPHQFKAGVQIIARPGFIGL